MSVRSKMRALVDRVRTRAEKSVSSGQFGYGICPADAYVARGIAELGDDGFEKAGFKNVNAEQAIKDASQKLTYCNSAMVMDDGGTLRMEKTASPGRFRDFLPEGMHTPEHTLMLLKYTLTAPTKDRDGDILRTEGAVVDPRGPLLWQHMANMLIGRHVLVTEHSKDVLKEVSALLDLNEFTEDVAKMVEADALRFSHGFQALEWEEIKSGRGGAPTGFDVKKFEVLERSLVSCPSNVSAVMELFSRQKFHSEPIKRWAKSIQDAQPVLVQGITLPDAAQEAIVDGKAKADEPEPEPEAEEEPEPESDESAPMLVCDECGHEMKAPADYDADKPMKCPECKTGTMLPKPDEEDEEEEEPEDDKRAPAAEKTIREVDGEFCVFSEAGKKLGCFPTKPEAEDRLAQIERFSDEGKSGEPDAVKAGDDGPSDEPKPDEEEPAAKKLVCEDCGYSMPMDKAEANEDGEYECPECGGKMNPAGEKAAEQVRAEAVADLVCPTCTGKMIAVKAGRVLSQRNMDGLVEAAADLEEAMDVDGVPRKCAALLERAHKRLVAVIDSAQPATGDEARPDARPKEPTGKSAEKTLGQFLATAEAKELSTIQEIIAARLDVIHRDARADALKSRGLI